MPLAFLSRARVRSVGAIATLAAVALLATGCSTPQGESTEPVAGGTLIYATGDAEPTCLDPHVGGNYPQALVATQYLESLVSKKADGEVVPWLATDWEEYGQQMLEVLGGASASFVNLSTTGDWMPRPVERAPTRFEKRGARLGHGVWDLAFRRV